MLRYLASTSSRSSSSSSSSSSVSESLSDTVPASCVFPPSSSQAAIDPKCRVRRYKAELCQTDGRNR
ncbi:hypothetical protein ARMGADRAFT_1020622 [Armillaria gallica]|uniref:Uncharacterized protein n=1 Tax=Armillaria gallica TaxID=47427 RepID=A0A2H3CXL1_ARMGA|nr:hypothetical protein ARMGADRAFT_1020622 [Armillaria gallica]